MRYNSIYDLDSHINYSNEKCLVIRYFLASNSINFYVKNSSLQFVLKEDVQFEPLEIKKIDLQFLSNTIFEPKIHISESFCLILPNVILTPETQIYLVSLYNQTDQGGTTFILSGIFST